MLNHQLRFLLTVGWYSLIVLCWVSICSTSVNLVEAQNGTPAADLAPSQSDSEIEVSVGIAGHVRLGLWTEIRVSGASLPDEGVLVAQAVDSDGIPVDYRWPFTRDAAQSETTSQVAIGYFRLGRLDHRVLVRVEDTQNKILSRKVLNFDEDAKLTLLPATRPIWLELGPDFGLTSATSRMRRSEDSGAVLVRPDRLEDLPQTVRGWESLNRLVGNTAAAQWPVELSPATSSSLLQWLKQGGRLSLMLDTESPQYFAQSGPLQSWTDTLEMNTTTTQNSSAIEYFVGSRSQLLEEGQQLGIVTFPQATVTELEIDKQPAIARFALGLGQVDLLGLDLASEPIKSWQSRNNLTAKWLAIPQASEARLNVNYGYLDLSGQLRSALDQFQRVGLISFTVVGGLLIAFLILVAVDYFLMRHVLKHPELTWVTLPLYCLLTCGAIFWLFQNSKADIVLANQAEIVDVDATTGLVSSRVWSNVYSPTAEQKDVSVGSNLLNLPVQSSQVGWNGLAGTGMGGMMSNKLSMVSDRPYSVMPQSSNAGELNVSQMPFDVASTRSIRGQWTSQMPTPVEANLSRRPGRDRLYGSFTNPFPVELKDCFMIHGGWAYRFRNTLPPGATVDIASQSDHVTPLVWLTRRKTISEKSSANQPWDPTESELHRILEMLMFYELAGGQDYTNLLNNYEPGLDFSGLRSLDRAVFLGRTDQTISNLELNGSVLQDDQFDNTSSAIRIVLPVEVEDRP